MASWAWGKSSVVKLEEDDAFRLPKSHQISENLDREGLEQSSMEKEIPFSNIGFRLLRKMGWQQGQGLGRTKQGIVDPIRAGVSEFRMGLGKQEQDDFYTNEGNIQRKKLEVEIEETEELAQKREIVAQRVEKLQAEVKEIRKTFYCELCNKQYKLASEYETHLSSYDHNHKKRFKESVRKASDKEKEDRQRREQLREEKELQRRAHLLSSSTPLPSNHQAGSAAAAVVGRSPVASASPMETPAAVASQRGALKFGFGGKGKTLGGSKSSTAGKSKTKAAPVASIFGGAGDDDEDD